VAEAEAGTMTAGWKCRKNYWEDGPSMSGRQTKKYTLFRDVFLQDNIKMAKNSGSSWTDTIVVLTGLAIAAVKAAEHFFKDESTSKK